MSINGGGDILARGGIRANFPMSSGMSQEKWDAAFAKDIDTTPDVGTIKRDVGGDGYNFQGKIYQTYDEALAAREKLTTPQTETA